jgi:hypothetical protein
MIRRALLIVLALLLVPSAALAVTQTASSGPVTASLSYSVKNDKFDLPVYSGLRLTIVRNGTTAYSEPVSDPFCGTQCAPAIPGTKDSSVQVADIGNTGEPNVILSLYSGGAHCCTIAQVFSYDPTTGTYTMARRNFADPAFNLKRLTPGGPDRFVSANPSFEYAFTSYAQSGEPLQIWGFQNGQFTDVTRSYPALIRKNAALWWRLFRHNLSDGTGPLSAWAADEELLGKNALVQSTLKAQLKAGHLVGGFINGAKYVKTLNRLLVKLGYEK